MEVNEKEIMGIWEYKWWVGRKNVEIRKKKGFFFKYYHLPPPILVIVWAK